MKVLKYLLYFLILLALIGFITVKVLSDPKPTGVAGPKADVLAENMLQTINKPAFDTLSYLEWEFFRPGQKYLWNKKDNKVKIEFDDVVVFYDLNSMEAKCFKNGEVLEGVAFEKAKSKAWSNWCNDSFWLIAPFKVFDEGTTRKVVDNEGKPALLIEYSSGGVTPGDAYLWILDDNNRPTGWKMWTSIIPIKGLYTSWGGWKTLQEVQLSTTHEFFGNPVSMSNVRSGKTLEALGYNEDLFAILN